MAFTTWSTTDLTNVTLSGGNLIATASAAGGGVRGKDPKRVGKFYIEYTLGATQNTGNTFGFATSRAALNVPAINSAGLSGAQSGTTGSIVVMDYFGGGGGAGSLGSNPSGLVLCCAINLDARLVWYRIGAGNWNGSAANNPTTGVGGVSIAPAGLGQGIDVYPYATLFASGHAVTANFGASAFAQAVPSGFTSGWDDSVAAVSYAVATQMGAEMWGRGAGPVYAQLTQIAVEEWASVALGAYPVASDQARALILA